ncbi:MAG: PD-(D/E)XK nuclease family protein, partial [Bdellovibrionota bacterium]
HLLTIRDELVASGWDRRASVSGHARLTDLAAAENSDSFHGDSDRLVRLRDRLLQLTSSPITHLTLVDEPKSFPKVWREILEQLEKLGTKVERHPLKFAPAKGDLGSIQTGKPGAPKSDGSFRLLQAQDPWQAARWTTSWLIAQKHLAPSETLIIAPERYRRILAAAFVERGVPFGAEAGSASYARPALQVLLLSLALAWSPKDPHSALSLMLLPASPIPKEIVPYLLRALNEAPAVGSDEWNEQIEKGLTKIREKETGAARAEKAQTRVKDFLESPTTDPQKGLSPAQVAEICSRVAKWARGYAKLDNAGPSFMEAAALADALARAVQDLEKADPTPLTPERLGSLIGDVVGTGVNGRTDRSRAGGPTIVSSPEQILGEAKTVIWWDFSFGAARNVPTPFWSRKDRELFRSHGIALEEPATIAVHEASSWTRPVLAAQDRFLAVTFEADAEGEAETPHPLYDQLLPADSSLRQAWSALTVRPAFDSSEVTRTFEEEASATRITATPGPWVPTLDWEAPKGAIALREEESASSLEKLLGCQLYYTLHYSANLSEPSHQLPDESILAGNLAHKVFETVFPKGARLTPDQAHAQAESELVRLLPIFAAPLLAPEMRLKRADLENNILRAVRSYATFLEANQLEVLDAERHVEGHLPGFKPKLDGYIDHVLGKHGKTELIIDHKLGGSSGKREMLSEGTALQLAIYSHLVGQTSGLPNIGYFIVSHARPLILDSGKLQGATMIAGDTPSQIWAKAKTEIDQREKLLESGKIQAEGLLDPPNSLWEAPCRFCSFDSICGKRWVRE